MKIIAKTADGYDTRFMVDISANELARLIGRYSQSSCPEFKIGQEIDFNPTYEAIRNIGYEIDIGNHSLKSKAEDLRKLADSLDVFNSSLQPLGNESRKIE